MGENEKVLRLSATLTLIILAFILIVIGWIGNVFAYGTQSGTLLDLRRGSRITDFIFIQPFEDKATLYFGTQSVTGSGSAGYIAGSSTAFPRMEYNANTLKFNFIGAGLQNEGADVGLASSMDSYILINAGTGTDNAFANPTLTGVGTLTATFRANGVDISDTEISYLDGVSSNIQNQIDVDIQGKIDTATGSISAHTHTGADGTAQISHNSITGTGTNSHSTIDSFIGSKAQANGLASLDSSSLVVQNPANATATPTASKILIADGSGKIADGWLNSTITALGQTIELGTETTGNTDNISEGSTNKYYTDARVNAAVGSLSVAAHSDVIFTSPVAGHKLVFDGSLNVVNGTDTAITTWSGITGNPTDNGSVSVTAGAGKIPVGSTSGYLEGWINNTIISIPGTTTTIAGTSTSGRFYNLETTVVGMAGDPYSKLLLHANNPGTSIFIDSSSAPKTVTAYGNAIGTSTAKLGSGAAAFDGTNDYLELADSDDWHFGAGNFTIECWVRVKALGINQAVFAQWADGNNLLQIYIEDASNKLNFYYKQGGTVVANYHSGTVFTTNIWYHIAVVRDGTNLYIFVDGSKDGMTTTTAIGSTTLSNLSATLRIGERQDGGLDLNGYIDEMQISKGIARWTANFTPPTSEYSNIHHAYNLQYIPPQSTTPILQIQTPGTATAEKSYILLNATTTVFGLGTTTAITGTTTAYSGWFDGAVRATAFNVASSEKIKDNIKPIKIKPEHLEAESRAKEDYVATQKPTWITDNEANYTYVGSDTATYVDTTAMEADYSEYIEMEWASDLNQDVYIDKVQKVQEQYFWRLFDAIQPKSWNPKDRPNLERKGFVVEEMPDVVKGDDKQSIDPMALIAYIAVSLQSIKQDNVTIMQALRDFAATGTFTVKTIEDRLEVLETN